MWLTYLLAGVVFAAVMLGMAVGVIISNRRMKGSCGGLANMRDSQGNTICDGCTNPSPECSGNPTESASLSEQ
jgi:hypothetical protein